MTYIKTDVSGYSKIASGSYTGNDTVNRGIPHGLGITPKFVTITQADATRFNQILQPGVYSWMGGTNYSSLAVTQFDSTNFYVGNATNYTRSGNNNTIVYYWAAFG